MPVVTYTEGISSKPVTNHEYEELPPEFFEDETATTTPFAPGSAIKMKSSKI